MRITHGAMSVGFGFGLALSAVTALSAAELLRLPAVKNFHLDTVLVSNGVAVSAVAAPGDPGTADLARRIREAIKVQTGAELPILTDVAALAELDQTGGTKRAMIVLGNLMTSKVSERLYTLEQLDVDAAWPGTNGFLLQTVHNPLGDGRNFISLGGSDFAGVQRAAEAFLAGLKPAGKSLTVGRLFQLETAKPGPKPLTGAEIAVRENIDFAYAIECGQILRRFGTPGYGKMFRRAIDVMAPSITNAPDEKAGKGGTLSFGVLPLLWDIIEESDQFSDADRAFISDILYAYAHRLRYAREDTDDMGAGGNNHEADSALYAGLYFNRYYPDLEIGRLLVERMDRYFASPITHWRVGDNATGYGDATWFANLQYALLRPNMTYFSSGRVRQAADYHIVITSNLGRSAGFGDSLSWSQHDFWYHATLLTMASWYYRDGGYLWCFKKFGGNPGALPAPTYWGKTMEGRYIVSGLDEQLPVRWLGVKPYPLDHWMYRGWKAPEPESENARYYFDKMSFRAGFETTNQYLLLSGFSDGYHGHPDANAVINFADNGYDFLVDSGYMRPDITEHNTVIVIRGETGTTLPKLARLDRLADFGDVAFTSTSVSNYNGTRWTRHMVWPKERYFAFLEEIEAEEDGNFDIRCVWRPRGNVSLNGRELTVKQGKQVMRLINLAGTPQTLQEGGQRLVQAMNTDLKKGRKTVLANLFFVTDEGNAQAIDAETLAPGVALVKEEGAYTVLGVGPVRDGAGLNTDAALFHAGPSALSACGVTRLTLAGVRARADKPVTLFLDFTRGTGVVDAAESARVTVVAGTETVLTVGPGRTAFRFEPMAGDRLARRQETLAGLFGAAAAARERRETRAQAESRKEFETQNARLGVLWESRDIPSAGSSTNRVKAGGAEPLCWLETADQNRDGKSEVLVGVATGAVVALSPEGTPLWTVPTLDMTGARRVRGGVMTAIGGPADRRIILAGRRAEKFRMACLKADGTSAWEAPLPDAPAFLFASEPAADGSFDIGVGAYEYIYGYSHKGESRWKFLNCERHQSTCGVVYDLNGDGTNEMAVGNDYFRGHIISGETGKSLMSLRMTWHAGPSAVALDDLDGDGKGDMVFGDRQGRLLFGVPWDCTNRLTLELAATVTFIKPADLNGDGRKEVVVGLDNGSLYAFDAAGKRLWRGNVDVVPRGVDFGDMDGNGRPDLLLDCEDKCLRILDDRGRMTARFTTESGVRGVRAAELDGNRRASECVIIGIDGRVIALRFQN